MATRPSRWRGSAANKWLYTFLPSNLAIISLQAVLPRKFDHNIWSRNFKIGSITVPCMIRRISIHYCNRNAQQIATLGLISFISVENSER